MDIGLMIAKERIKKNMSKPQLAKIIGCSTRTIEYWESGKRNISLLNLDKVLRTLNLTLKIGQESDLA